MRERHKRRFRSSVGQVHLHITDIRPIHALVQVDHALGGRVVDPHPVDARLGRGIQKLEQVRTNHAQIPVAFRRTATTLQLGEYKMQGALPRRNRIKSNLSAQSS